LLYWARSCSQVLLFAFLLVLTQIVEGTAPRESVEHLVSGSARHS
jgi:hypothetical protein